MNNWGLQIQTGLGTYEFEKPQVYQLDSLGNRIALPWQLSWTMPDTAEAKFSGWGNYDLDLTLVIEIGRAEITTTTGCSIDNLCWSSYVGAGIMDESKVITHDKSGFIYQAGNTTSPNFPTTPFVVFDHYRGAQDAFLIKYDQVGDPNSSLGNMKWATYFGGAKDESASGVAIANNGDIYLAGTTNSDRYNDYFPYKQSQGTNAYNQLVLNGNGNNNTDAFIFKVSSDGRTQLWTDWIGGELNEDGLAIVIDDAQNIFLAGYTESDPTQTYPFPFPSTSPGNGAFVQPSMGNDLRDAFIMKFNSNDHLVWSSYIGGDDLEKITSICILQNDGIAVTGYTLSGTDVQTSSPFDVSQASNPPEFPVCYNSTGSEWCQTTNHGYSDAFAMVFNQNLQLVYSTLIGGAGVENNRLSSPVYFEGGIGKIISTDPPSLDLFLTGTSTRNTNFPLHDSDPNSNLNYYQNTVRGNGNIFISKLIHSSNGYYQGNSTFFGGSNSEFSGDIVTDVHGNYYLCGATATTIAADGPDFCLVPQIATSGFYPFPICNPSGEYFDKLFNGGYTDGFVIRMNSFDYLDWATYLGGNSSSNPHPPGESINSLTIAYNGNQPYLYFGGYTDDHLTFPERQDYALYYQPPASNNSMEALVGRFTLPVTTGISDQDEQLTIVAFPNPATTLLNIRLNDLSEIVSQIKIVDMLGKIVYFQKNNSVHSVQVQIDVSNFSPGMYYLSMKGKNGVYYFKFVKQ